MFKRRHFFLSEKICLARTFDRAHTLGLLFVFLVAGCQNVAQGPDAAGNVEPTNNNGIMDKGCPDESGE